MLFHLQPSVACINDINPELIRVYTVIKNDVEALIAELEKYENTSEYFYAVRDWDRDKEYYAKLSEVQKAARVLYLNKTCFNGLYRVNNAGEFNSPFGNYRNPNIVNAPVLRAVSAYFNTADISMTTVDYEDVLKTLPKELLYTSIPHMTRFQKPPVLQDILNVALPAQTKLDCVNAVTNYLSAA